MLQFTEVIDSNQIKHQLTKIVDEFNLTDEQFTLSKMGINIDPVQSFLYYDSACKKDPILTPIIASAAVTAEHRVAGAGKLFLNILLSQIKSDIRRQRSGCDFDNSWQDIRSHVKDCAKLCTRSQLLLYLKRSLNKITFNIVCDVLNITTINDKVKICKGINDKTKIQHQAGFRFKGVHVDPQFLSKGSWNRSNCRVVLIDGIIESVSEIYRLLEQVSQDKVPCVIFCIDALPDVISTILHNFKRGTLDVVIVPIPVDESHVNMLVDLGIVTNVEPLCAAKGDAISMAADYHKKVIKKIVIERGAVTIEDDTSQNSVFSHLNELEKRLIDDPKLSIILQPRIDTLLCKTLTVFVGTDDLKKNATLVEELDSTFRSLPSIISNGFIEKDELNALQEDYLELLFKRESDFEPAARIIQAIDTFISVRKSILEAGAAIKFKKN